LIAARRRSSVPGREEELESEDEIEHLEVARVLADRTEDLADQQRVVAGGLADRPQCVHDFGPVRGVEVLEPRRVLAQRQRERLRRGRVVAKLLVLDETVDRVEAEAVGAAPAPEANDALHRLDHLRVAPVEVGLLRVERVHVPAAAALVPAPGRPAESGDPVVRGPLDGRPDVPVRMLAEPGVLDRGVAEDQVEQDAEPPLARSLDELVEVLERAQLRVDRGVVRDVVPEVGQRRGVDRRKPEGVHAEPGEVVEPLGDPAEVADAVPVGVLEGAGIDLVDDCVAPPHDAGRIEPPRG